jgi:hypothetical protein
MGILLHEVKANPIYLDILSLELRYVDHEYNFYTEHLILKEQFMKLFG